MYEYHGYVYKLRCFFRWGWKKFDLYGFEVQRGERRNIQAEIQKLKELILPTMARDIYTGRGIRLPE